MNNKKVLVIVVSLLLIVGATSVYMVLKEDSSKNSANTPRTCTTYNNTVEEQCIEDYIGLTQEDAVARAKQYKYTPKIVSIDGVEQVVTSEGGSPILLKVENGSVVGGSFQ